jgi:hypothetical protein
MFSSFILQIKTPLVTNTTAAWRTVYTRQTRAHLYGAPLGIYIAKVERVNISNSTTAILSQIVGNAK